MKEQNSSKRANFRESGETANGFGFSLLPRHITNIGQYTKTSRIRDIFTPQIRDMGFVLSLHNLVGVEMQ